MEGLEFIWTACWIRPCQLEWTFPVYLVILFQRESECLLPLQTRAPGTTTFPCPFVHLSLLVWHSSEIRVSPGPPWTALWQSDYSQVQGLGKVPTGIQMDFHTWKDGCIKAESLFPKVSGSPAQSHLKKCDNCRSALRGLLGQGVVHPPGLCPLYSEAGLVPVLLYGWYGSTGGRDNAVLREERKNPR